MIFKIFVTLFLVDAASVAAVQMKRSWGDGGSWNNRCILPPCPDHANYEVTGVMESWHGEKWPTEVVFTCWPGYTLVGSRAIECYDGRWSDHTPQCIDYRTRGVDAGGYGYTSTGPQYDRESFSGFPSQYLQQQHVSNPQQFEPRPQHFVSHHQQHEPYPQQFVSQPQQSVPQPQRPVEQPQQLIPQPQQPNLTQQPIPQPQQPIPQPQQSIPQQQQPLPQPQQPIPQPQQPIPQPQQSIPQPQQPVSQLQPFIPQQQLGINNCCSCDISSQQLTPQQQQPMTQPQPLRARGEQPKKTSPATGGCIIPPYPANGTYKLTTVMNTVFSNQRLPANLTYKCRSGFERVGVPFITCLGGRWSDDFPTCRASESAPVDDEDTGDSISPDVLGGTLNIAVVGGTAAGRSELPWHVGIYDQGSTPFVQICGGSIISENRVISAAHCFWDDLEKLRPASQFAVGAGKLYRDWDDDRDTVTVQKVDVTDIKVPPRYQHVTASFQEDIALITVATNFMMNRNVMSVIVDFNMDLDSRQLRQGNLGKVGGWGLITEDGVQATDLQVVLLPNVGIEQCIAENDPSFQKYITGDKICAGYRNGTAVCMGDSGGGLIFTEYENGTQSNYLRGIVSTAPSNDNACNIYDWTTFTHLLRHDHFLQPLLNA